MWDRRRSEPQPDSLSARQPATMPKPLAAPLPPRLPENAGRATSIGETITIIGDLYSNEDVVIDGHVRGKLEIRDSRLTVGPKGKAESNVTARDVLILGSVKGDVDATSKITIRKQGSLVGNIRTAGIVIDDDAYFKGNIDIVRKAEAAKA